jgi:hypothetical protein
MYVREIDLERERSVMARLSFGLYEAHSAGRTIEDIAGSLGLPEQWVADRIEAARLCLMLIGGTDYVAA